MSALAIVAASVAYYVGGYALLLRRFRPLVSTTDCYNDRRSDAEMIAIAVGCSLLLAVAWPLIMLGLAPTETRAARRAAERVRLAQQQAAEAKALAERLEALGLEP